MSDTFQTGQQLDSDRLHQLRNRLTVVKGVAQLLDRQVRQDDWHRGAIISRVDQLQSEISNMEHLIDGFDPEDRQEMRSTPDDRLH
jgi:nitrogen-specific signal transduction histidine kinase